MKKIEKEELQPVEPEIEKAAEEPKDVEETSEPVIEEEPKKEKKGMPRLLKFIIFELLTIIIAWGVHFCLLQFVMNLIDLGELYEWLIVTGAAFVLYLVAGYLFNHLIVWKGKGKNTFWKFLLSALIGWGIAIGLAFLGIFITKLIVPTNPLHYDVVAFSINHILAHGGKSTPSGLGILGIDMLATMLYSFLIRNFFVFKDKKEKVVEEAHQEEVKEETILTHDTFRQIVREEMDKFFTSKRKFVRYSQAQSYIDEGIKEYDEKHPRKKEEE